jgi:predicted transposase YdaD
MEESDESIHQPHDKLFKAGFSDPVDAGAFLRWRLPPALVEAVDWGGLQLEPGSFVDSQFRLSESDLLFSAPFLDSKDGSREACYFYFLLEHFSARPRFAALQILRYLVRIWDHHLATWKESGRSPELLPPIVPLVVAQNATGWDLSPRFADLVHLPRSCEDALRPFTPDFAFSLLELANMPYDAIAGTPAGILALRVLKAERSGELLGDAVWDEALLSQVARGLFERVLRYLMGGGIDKEAFRRRLEKVSEPRIRNAAMTLAEQFVKEGIEKGIEKGIERGIEAGKRSDIIEALEVRFGVVPDQVRETISVIRGDSRLRHLHRAAILAASLDDFVSEL